MEIFGVRLKELREAYDEKQKDMAALLGCSVRHYQAIEAGEINLPSMKLKTLAEHFNVSMDFLMGRTDKKEVNR